ncbi:MAG: type 1 glutamine amidotransferase domain-containing protein [Flavobacteriales bacterium]
MRLKERNVICLVENDFEDLELYYPILRLQEEGANVEVVGPQQHNSYKGKNGLSVRADQGYAQIDPDDYDALFIPGGWAPDKLRRSEHVLSIVRRMEESQRPIGQICHAGWVLASAGIAQGKRLTSTPGIKDDMINAGADWVDESSVVDGHLVSARRPYDLPDMMPDFIQLVAELEYA